jgi:DNA-binding transcriptional ArsR family regulator
MHPSHAAARFDVATFGEMIADPSRVAMLFSLMDGLARPASELARIAGVSASTASAHLARLAAAGFVRAERVGRHRYYRLSGAPVAEAIEAIALHAPTRPTRAAAAVDPARAALAHARTCYRHLAGRLGVAWLAALEAIDGLRLDRGAIVLTATGARALDGAGLGVAPRLEGKACLDWTERRPHLGGALGVAITQQLLALRWLARRSDTRALRVTSRGRAGFLGLGVPAAVIDDVQAAAARSLR